MSESGSSALSTHRLLTDLMRLLEIDDAGGARTLLAKNKADIENMCALLEKSRLAGYFYTLVRDTALTSFFTDEQLAALAARYQRQINRNEANLALLRDIQKALASASIPFLTIKGLYLGQRFFGDIHKRFMWDIDILVHPQDLEAAITQLKPLGFHSPPGFRFNALNKYWGIHAVEVRSQRGKLDIHHAIRQVPGIHFNYDRMWSQAQEFSIEESRFAAQSDADTLLTAAVGLASDLQASHHNLRKIWDICQLLKQLDASIDWNVFIAERKAEGSLKLVINMFTFCLLITGTESDCALLARAISPHKQLILIRSEEQAEAIFARNRQNITNRLLYSRLLPISPYRYWLRWLLTLPVRVWHYRRAKSRRKQKR